MSVSPTSNGDTVSIVVGGDLCPIGKNEPHFIDGNAEVLFGDLLDDFRKADLVVVGLEGPLVQTESPTIKAGLHLAAHQSCINGIRAAGIDVLNLANNHIMDHGLQGLESTLEVCKENCLDCTGAGNCLEEAGQVYKRELNGVRLGILCIAEYEFGMATRMAPGVNPLDVMSFARRSAKYRSEFDYLLVLLHGGNEFYPYPRPGLLDTCRFLVEQGASAVICQHTHCAGCMETYQGAPIVYGQGNLLFDLPLQNPMWYEGVLVRLVFEKNKQPVLDMIPVTQSRENPGVRRMPIEMADRFRNAFRERSREIQTPSTVEARWLEFCVRNERHYLNTLHGKATQLRRIAGRLGFLHRMDSKRVRSWRLNMIQCESHREAVITLLSMDTHQRGKILAGMKMTERTD